MPGSLFIEGDKVNLRTVEKEDYDFIKDNHNDPEVREKILDNKPTNSTEVEERVKKNSESDIFLMIYSDKEPVGRIKIRSLRETVRRTELGIWVTPEEQGKGYAVEASELFIEYLFNQIGIHKIVARLFTTNKGSRKLWEKLGFKQEAILEEEYFANGKNKDIFYYSITKSEWRSE